MATARFESTLYDDNGHPTTVSVLIEGDVTFGLKQVRLFVDTKLCAVGVQAVQSKPRGRPVGTTNEEMERRRNEGRPYGEVVDFGGRGR